MGFLLLVICCRVVRLESNCMEDKIRSVADRLMVGNWVIRLEKGMFLGIIGSVITPLCLVELCIPLAGYIFNTNLIAGIFLALLNCWQE